MIWKNLIQFEFALVYRQRNAVHLFFSILKLRTTVSLVFYPNSAILKFNQKYLYSWNS